MDQKTFDKEWKRLIKATDPQKMQKLLEKNFRVAARRIGLTFVKFATKAIKRRDYLKNSPITIAFKGSTMPLVTGSGQGELIKAIGFEVIDAFHVLVGTKGLGKKGSGGRDLTEILHNGAVIDMRKHPQVRRWLFWMMGQKMKGNRAKLASKGESYGRMPDGSARPTGVIVIPPRPYIMAILRNDEFQSEVQKHWAAAWHNTLNGKAFAGG